MARLVDMRKTLDGVYEENERTPMTSVSIRPDLRLEVGAWAEHHHNVISLTERTTVVVASA
jgi:hypothetical protein